jgi:hypothetical protein
MTQKTSYTIKLNTRTRTVDDKKQTYESIVELFLGGPIPADALYSVTFEKTEHAAPKELVAGGKPVEIVDGKSRFYVEEAGKS